MLQIQTSGDVGRITYILASSSFISSGSADFNSVSRNVLKRESLFHVADYSRNSMSLLGSQPTVGSAAPHYATSHRLTPNGQKIRHSE